MIGLLNQFYLEREITVTSTDPHYVTPAVKAMLRRKNRLMRAGRTDEATVITSNVKRLLQCITLKLSPNSKTLRKHFPISLRCSMAREQLTVRASQQLNITQKWKLVPKLHNIFS